MMNVLSDILCHSSSLILSSSCNGPLLSHNSEALKSLSDHSTILATNKGQLHLLETLSTMPNIERQLPSNAHNSSPSEIENSVYHASNPGHTSTNIVPSNFNAHHEAEQASSFASNSFHSPVPSWVTNDLIKASENISTVMLPPVAEIYPTPRNNENLSMLDLGYPPDLTSQRDNTDNINRTCIANSHTLISETTSPGFSSADSLLMSTFSNMSNSQLQVAVEKSRLSYEKYQHNSVAHSNNSAQSIINTILPLGEHCDINPQNELHLPLSSQMADQCLNTSVSSTIMTSRQNRNHSIDIAGDKLPHITLTQLDSLLESGNAMTGIQMLQNNFPNVRIPEEISCNNHSQGIGIQGCNANVGVISCHNGSLSNLNLAPFSQSQEVSLEVTESLTQTALESEMANCISYSNDVNCGIEETRCFKCKYCTFISLDKFQVANHIRQTHSKHVDSISMISDSGLRSVESSLNYNGQDIFSSNSLTTENLNSINSSCADTVTAVTSTYGTENFSQPLVYSDNRISSKQSLTSMDKSQFACNNCKLTFRTLKSYQAHLASDHNVKPNYLRLESLKCKTNSESVQTNLSKSQMQDKNFTHVGGNYSKIKNKRNTVKDTVVRDKLLTPKIVLPDKRKDESLKKNNQKSSSDDSKLSSAEKQVSSHKKAWQKKMKRELGSYICEFKGCNVRFRALDNLEYHRQCHIAGGGTFACPECGVNFEHWGTIAGHLWRHHSNDMELHACNQCSFRTYSLSRLENLHKRIHKDEYLFLCDTCGKGFKNGKQLRSHRDIHSKGPTKAQRKKFECCVCLRHFCTRRKLCVHLDTVHNKLKPLICNYCGYSTSKGSTLRMHLRMHTGEKPFSCDLCKYQTSDHNSLRRHKRMHSGEKPYKCPYCAYACIQSSTYKSHLKNKHPGQDEGLMFSCNLCTFKTIKQDIYFAHLAEHKMENMSEVDNSTLNFLSDRSQEFEMLPLVEAMDISLSHGDRCILPSMSKDHTDIQ